MNKLILSILSLFALCFTSLGQIQISGGGTGTLTFTVLQDIGFKIDSGDAWGYIWGVRIPNSLSAADTYNTGASLLAGSGPGGVSIVGAVSPSVTNTMIAAEYGPSGDWWVHNGVALTFEFNSDFQLVSGNTFTIRQGTYERNWGGYVAPNTLVNPGATYTITAASFFSFTESGTELNTSNISLVPEPSALSLLALGLGGFAVIRIRRS